VHCLCVGDIGPDTPWDGAALGTFDTVVHLAARVHVLREKAVAPAVEFHRVNVAGTERLARAAAGRVCRLVYVSSVHAMCTLADEVLDEASPCRPDTPYGESKLAAEETLRAIAEKTGLETVIVRPPPVYGPGILGNLGKLFRLVRKGWPLPLRNIANRRSLIYVENLANALVACSFHPAAGGRTFLVSDGEDVSVADLVRRAGAAFGRRVRLVPAPIRLMRLAGRCLGKSGAVERLVGSLAVSSDRIRRLLSWSPPYTMAEGFQVTARWVENNS
jgi:nucleoside-diphosphate-sugar epimerase